MFISEYFGLGSKLSDMGVFDALLDKDSHFFINVICLKKTNIPEFNEAYLHMNRYFSDIATLLDAADAPVMVVHLTNRKAFEEVMRARMNGQKVYAETCPQYLLLDDSVYSKPDFEGAKYVCAPPIRKKADQDCLWKALANDQIQTVATDQCSFTMEQKALGKDDFTKIPGGLPGVQTRGTLLYTYGVRTGRITQEQMCRLLSENAAKLYGVYPNKGVIREGSDADIVVFDPEKENVISAKTHLYHTDNNPYEGFKLHGDIDSVYLSSCGAGWKSNSGENRKIY